MLKERLITAVLLLVLVVIFLLSPPAWTQGFFLAVFVIAGWEWGRLSSLTPALQWLYAAVVGALLALLWWVLFLGDAVNVGIVAGILAVACAAWLVLFKWVLSYPQSAETWGGQPMRVAIGLVVLVPAWVGLAYLRMQEDGSWLILYVMMLVASADVGAYFTGRAFGRHKMAPRVSPGKTLEGLAGGLAAVCLFAAAVSYLAPMPASSGPGFIALSLIAGAASVLGDLVESMVKRHAGVKDSGTLLPGHGGVMDRIDSLAVAVPLFSLGIVFLQMPAA